MWWLMAVATVALVEAGAGCPSLDLVLVLTLVVGFYRGYAMGIASGLTGGLLVGAPGHVAVLAAVCYASSGAAAAAERGDGARSRHGALRLAALCLLATLLLALLRGGAPSSLFWHNLAAVAVGLWLLYPRPRLPALEPV